MKKFLVLALGLIFLPVIIHAQQDVTSLHKFALVIGNSAYSSGLSKLNNAVNDANDMAVALENLGFTTEKLLNAYQDEIDSAVMKLKNRLSVYKDSYGFFFYAGHGVQSNGENYLIPIGANIPGENQLRSRAVSVQGILDDLNDAGNKLNVVVLDACRDNPFGWSRSGSRGLAIMKSQPADSIVVYATSAGSTASDGSGRNGLFTSHLLENLKTQGLEVSEVFKRTGADVSASSGRQQIPAVYNQFFGTAYLGSLPVIPVFEAGHAVTITGSLEILAASRGIIDIIGTNINQTVEIPDKGHLPIEKISTGKYEIVIRYENGKSEKKTIDVRRNEVTQVEFKYLLPVPKPPPEPKPTKEPKPPTEPKQPKESKPAKIPTEKAPNEPMEKNIKETGSNLARLNSLGVSVGSTFAAPMLIAALQGTWSPFKYTYAQAGVDFGMQSRKKDAAYWSIYPFFRYSFYYPFNTANASVSGRHSGWYLGTGCGWMRGKHVYPEGDIPVSIFAFDVSSGFIIFDFLDISYALRTDFEHVNHKVSIGYVYRFL